MQSDKFNKNYSKVAEIKLKVVYLAWSSFASLTAFSCPETKVKLGEAVL